MSDARRTPKPEHQVPSDILAREVDAICKRYRAAPAQARAALVAAFTASPGLIEAIRARHPAEDVTRLRAYKAAVKEARKQIYYQLRQYRRLEASRALEAREEPAPAERLAAQIREGAPAEAIHETCHVLLQTHVSTAERDQDAFYKALFDLIEPPTSVLDVGCGLQPLAYPFATTKHTELYVAVDRDPETISILETFAPLALPAALVPIQADLETFQWGEVELIPDDFDLALMLKLVPVVRRRSRDLLPFLADVPARRILITGNVEALTRRERIRAREDKALREFVTLSGRRVAGHFETPGEFGYVLVF